MKKEAMFYEKLVTINYGEITSAALDPIEKKPLYYFKPHTQIFSVGSFGCNFTCGFCQNYSISQFVALKINAYLKIANMKIFV
ncbi:hypothetical protein AGR56_00290 [Clostridium sp. DMHC 10]|nr:hypothetical protein AGR56_00290 [Clostridium sp. DMHC 10]